jgi:mercuric ion transport protein
MASPFQKAAPLPASSETERRGSTSESAALATGGLAALLAGACCLGPFVLVSIGLGGAWLANFQLLEPYRPLFIGIALVALGFAWKRIYRPAVACEPGAVCAAPRVRRGYKIGFWLVGALFLLTLTFPYYASLLY